MIFILIYLKSFFISCQPDRLSGFYDITSFNQILEIVAIKCFQSVSVADYNPKQSEPSARISRQMKPSGCCLA